jgi:predicted transposase YbfD/YdcC
METSVSKFFGEVKDPRIERKKLYPLEEILLVALCCIISGGEGFDDMKLYGEEKLDFLRKFYPFANGIASEDTFSRVFQLICPDTFTRCFAEWMKDLQSRSKKAIAIDGKLARRSSSEKQKALHMVSAFAHEEGLVLAQQPVDDKSNEITAIPYLLEVLEVKGNVLTIDAMGCQKEIAKTIIEKEGDYVLSLKGNQGNLEKDVKAVFSGTKKARFIKSVITEHKTVEKDHGRIECRHYKAIAIENIPINISDWAGIKSIVEVHATREIKDEKSEETRYYISSLKANAKELGQYIRGHWSIENSLHWTLDVTFNEDQSRIRTGNAPKNLSVIKHASFNLLKLDDSKGSVRGKRKRAGWSDAYMEQLLNLKILV